MKKSISLILVMCLLSAAMMISTAAAYTCSRCYTYTATGEVIVDNAYLYEEHSFYSATVVKERMQKKRDVYIMKACPELGTEDTSKGWLYVRIVYDSETLYGWMYGSYIDIEHEELRLE